MSPQTEEFSLCGARLLVFLVLIAVTAGITLANVSSEPVTIDLVAPVYAGKSVERAYGWPLAWYWRNWNRFANRRCRAGLFQGFVLNGLFPDIVRPASL